MALLNNIYIHSYDLYNLLIINIGVARPIRIVFAIVQCYRIAGKFGNLSRAPPSFRAVYGNLLCTLWIRVRDAIKAICML